MFNKCLSALHSWLLQLLSTCTSVDFCWRSVCGTYNLFKSGNTKTCSNTLLIWGLFSTALHTTDTHWLTKTEHPLSVFLIENNTHVENVARVLISTEEVENTWKQVTYIVNPLLFFCLFILCDRSLLWYFSLTSPPSSSHTNSFGRRWFIPCYRKSGGPENLLTPWG